MRSLLALVPQGFPALSCSDLCFRRQHRQPGAPTLGAVRGHRHRAEHRATERAAPVEVARRSSPLRFTCELAPVGERSVARLGRPTVGIRMPELMGRNMALRLRDEVMPLTVRALATSAVLLLLVIAPGRAGASCCRCSECPTGVPVPCFTSENSCPTPPCPCEALCAACGDSSFSPAGTCGVGAFADCETIDGTPVPSATPTAAVRVPTLTPWGLLGASLALAGFGALTLRRRMRRR